MISPLFSKFFFRYQKISGKHKVSFTKLFVSVLWDKKFRQNRDAPPPSYAWKFSMKEFFWNTKVFSNEIFRYSETKTSTENRDTPLPPLIQTFSIPEINETLKDSTPYGNFRHCETKNFRQKIFKLLPPPPLLSINFFATGNFLKQAQKGSPTKFFGTVRQKILNEKSSIEYRNQWWNWCL